MKVCFLITGLGIGGAEKHLLKMLPELKFDKFVISLTNLNDIGKLIEKIGIKVHYLGLNKFNLPLVVLRFKKILKKEKPDILDTYLIHSNIFGRIFGRIFGVKKIISSVRNDYSDYRLLSFLDRITQGLIDLYIINSNALFDYVKNKNRISINKIKIVFNGIDLNSIYKEIDKNYDIRYELNLKKDSFILISTARLQQQKDISTLIRALKKVNESIFLVIAGEGGERNHLNDLTKKLNLSSRIFFLGNRYDIPNLLNSSNAFVLPSLKEGMSNALLEAMALKKNCIVSNITQNEELIKDGVNGLTFEKGNENQLANKIEMLFNNRELNYGHVAYNLINKKYLIKDIARIYEKVVQNLVKSNIVFKNSF